MDCQTKKDKDKKQNSLFFDVLNHFPVPIEVFNSDGLSIYVNKEFLDFFHITDQSDIVGKFNLIEDSFINEELGFSEYIERVFSGEILSFTDVRVPFNEMLKRYDLHNTKQIDKDIYQDIISFPFLNNDGSVDYIISVFITKHVYQSRLDTIKAREYIDNHWMEDFNLDDIAVHTGLCRHYLSRLFKSYIGMTPYGYYQDVKINKIKEALGDFNLSISEAFISCGVDYSGGMSDAFKRKTKMTPSIYRKTLYKQENNNLHESDQSDPFTTDDKIPDKLLENKIFYIAELFPIPIQIFKANGDIVYINNAVLRMWNILDDKLILGKYNLLRDPFVKGFPKISEGVKRAFQGEIVLISDIKIPLESFWEWYKTRSEAYDIEAVYTDILNFPINDSDGNMIYMISIFFTSRIYQGKSEIARAREYIENNWCKEFDIVQASKAACLSPSHLVRLFIKHTGVTPYKYYQNIKIKKLKEALRDKNLSIAQVFASCGFNYSGNYARLFKKQVGMTPSQYRKSIKA